MNDPVPALPALVDLYLLRCDVEGKSARTVHAYRETLTRFLRALDEDGGPPVAAEIESAHLYSYLGRYTHLRTETRHRYFREVRCFFNWLVDAGYLDHSPFRGMRNVRVPQRIVQP
ncbi:MAG: site-specific integrase, partial [Dehalococcoidia bacterium]